ncbi:MAG: iron ABC transporter permease [Prevotella sp.]|nr:iron ABC transporter permease [Alistipes senegalensis]MCM1358136.1 iron ABC transporter permease [Prevotella sp.]
MKRKLRYIVGFSGISAGLTILFFISLVCGSAEFSLEEIIEIISGKGDITGKNIIFQIRLPRVTAAALLGGALSVSGFLLQTFFSNPIASPFVLGISSSAKLAMAIVMIFCTGRGIIFGSVSLVLAAFVGAMAATGFILGISGRVKNMSVLVVCGVMVGYICTAATDIMVNFADDSNIINLHNWSVGTFSGTDWGDIKIIAVIVSACVTLTFLLSKPISAYQMGEGYAMNMGVNVKLFRLEIILLSSILSACVTAFAGVVSFVGIAVPHIIKALFGTAKPIIVIPACFLGGGFFCLLCDLIARTLFAPTELGISSVTAVFGAPVVLWVMLGKHRRSAA